MAMPRALAGEEMEGEEEEEGGWSEGEAQGEAGLYRRGTVVAVR